MNFEIAKLDYSALGCDIPVEYCIGLSMLNGHVRTFRDSGSSKRSWERSFVSFVSTTVKNEEFLASRFTSPSVNLGRRVKHVDST